MEEGNILSLTATILTTMEHMYGFFPLLASLTLGKVSRRILVMLWHFLFSRFLNLCNTYSILQICSLWKMLLDLRHLICTQK
ncbi:hypothetical protein O6P43_015665 [Quillaja saponaria]|uniref:Uncharacterized protein n=1 Tax=Quillaja saponaria TaxID=32244 RepID=A0AAD7PT43_QUISA|nr:hypothetical protein O6P43_015665 [Quillaja saponaria]